MSIDHIVVSDGIRNRGVRKLHRTRAVLALAASAVVAASMTARAAVVTYDANTGTSGAQDGVGAGWNTSATNWWDGSADVLWPNTTADTAIFGAGSGAAGTVTVGTVTTNAITFNAAGSGNYTLSGGTITLGGTTPTITTNVNATISSILAPSGATLTKAGAGTLTLNASSPYSAATVVNQGTLALGASGAGPYTLANSDVTVNAPGTFTFGGDTDTRNITTTIAKSLTLNGGTARLVGTFRSPTDVFTNDLSLSSGASVLAVDGAQNGGFGSAVRFNGTLSRSAGATALFRGKNLGGSNTIDANNTNQPQNIQFVSAPTLTGGGGALNTTTTSILPYIVGDNGYLQGSHYLTSGLGTDFVSYNPTGGTGAGIQLLTTYATSITSGSSVLHNVKVTDATAAGVNAATAINSLILNSAAATTGSPGTSAVDGTGTLTINSGAVLVTTTSAAASNGGTGGNYGGLFTNNATVGASGLTLDFGSREAIITTAGASTMTVAAQSGGITGTGGLSKSGAGVLNLDAANTFSGTTTLNAGSMRLGHAAALQNSTLNYNNQGGMLSFGTLTAATLGGLAGSQDLALTNGSAADVALSVGNAGGSTTYAGALSGGGSLIKIGSATFTLTGAGNNYTGATNVDGGTLLVNGSLGNTAVAVNSGGTLGGGGDIAGTVTVNIGGTLAPGNSAGKLNTGSLSLATGSDYAVELNGTSISPSFQYDQTDVTGTVTLAGNLMATLGYAPTLGDKLFIVSNDLDDAVSGTFAGLAQGATIDLTYSSTVYRFQISYVGDFATISTTAGNDVVLTNVVVPEPTALAGLAMGALALVRRRRR